MRKPKVLIALGVPAALMLGAVALLHDAASADPQEGVSLLATLEPWKYPGSEFLEGARASDGGFPGVQSVKCQTILTTPDPVEKVVAFYRDKFDAPTNPDQPAVPAQSVSFQDDSDGRPVRVHVVVVNRADSSTTLVISRATEESKTHITWSHYLRLGDSRRQPDGVDVEARP